MATNEPSVETVSNNVFVSHPAPGEGHPDLVPFGMYIQPSTILIGDVIVSGFKVVSMVSKEEGGLADQAKLLVGDLLVALDDIFVDQKSLEDVLNLFETRPPKFSMTVIRQDTEAEGAPKYKSWKITIVLGVVEGKVVVRSSFCEKEVLYQYNQTVKSVNVWQELNDLTKYITATSKTAVAMQTWSGESDTDQYLWDLYVYNAVSGDTRAVVFYNEKYGASITCSEPGKDDGKIYMKQNKAKKPPVSLKSLTYNLFADNSTGTMFEFGFESIKIADQYMTTDNNDWLVLTTGNNDSSVLTTGNNDPLVLTTEEVQPKDLPMNSLYFMAMVPPK